MAVLFKSSVYVFDRRLSSLVFLLGILMIFWSSKAQATLAHPAYTDQLLMQNTLPYVIYPARFPGVDPRYYRGPASYYPQLGQMPEAPPWAMPAGRPMDPFVSQRLIPAPVEMYSLPPRIYQTPSIATGCF